MKIRNIKKNAKIDWRGSLKNDEQRQIFDKLKAARLQLAKNRNLKAAYLVCKDEHLAAIVQKPNITEDEIKNLPNGANILLKEFANSLYQEYQKILTEKNTAQNEELKQNEESEIPF